MIVRLAKEHIDNVVQIHINSFPKSPSTNFGKVFLKSYYEGACESKKTCSFIYIKDNKLVGFIFGGINKQEQSLEIAKKEKFILLLVIFKNLLTQPVVTGKRFFSYFLNYLLPKKEGFYNDLTATLDSIAIDENVRGSGVADHLMQIFLQDLRNRGIEICRLGVLSENISARRLYERNGFEQANVEGTIYLYYFNKEAKEKYRKFRAI